MSTLLLRLAGVTQAWDTRRYDAGGALSEGRFAGAPAASTGLPTKTGIAGMLAAALGRDRSEPRDDLMRLRMMVRTDQPGRSRREFRTTRRRTTSGQVVTRPMVERVLDDAVFLVAVEGNRDLLLTCADALGHPRYPLFLGQLCYPPSGRILLDIQDGDARDILADYPWIASEWYQRTHDPRWVVVDLEANSRAPSPDWFEVVASAQT